MHSDRRRVIPTIRACDSSATVVKTLMGVIANIVNAINIIAMAVVLIAATEYMKLKVKNFYAQFTFKEYNPETHESLPTYAHKATLIWDLHHEFKFRVWHAFWNGMFKSCQDKDKESNAVGQSKADFQVMGVDVIGKDENDNSKLMPLMDPIMDRWEVILEGVENAGIKRIMQWLFESDPDILESYKQVQQQLEGIDVYCPPSLIAAHFDHNDWDADATLIEDARGGDKDFDSRTCFGKMYVKTFPLCAMIVFDDSDDKVQLYNHSVHRLFKVNTTDRVSQMRETRRNFRAAVGKTLKYPMKFYKDKTETETYTETEHYKDAQGKDQTRKVTKTEKCTQTVLFKFKKGSGRLKQKSFDGSKQQTSAGSLDVSAGFDWSLHYSDGSGGARFTFPKAGKAYNKEYHDEPHSASLFAAYGEHSGGIGFNRGFVRDSVYKSLMEGESHGPTEGNKATWEKSASLIWDAQQAYRNDHLQKRIEDQSILSDFFWTHVYNNCDLAAPEYGQTIAQLGGRVPGQTQSFPSLLEEQPNAFKYLWARWNYCQRDDRLAWWFTFWDCFWNENCNMNVIQHPSADVDFEIELGPSNPSSIMYNCIPKDQLIEKLTKWGLYAEGNEAKQKLFYPSLVDKMYKSQDASRGTFARKLTPETKEMMIAGNPLPPIEASTSIQKFMATGIMPPLPPPRAPPLPPHPNWRPDAPPQSKSFTITPEALAPTRPPPPPPLGVDSWVRQDRAKFCTNCGAGDTRQVNGHCTGCGVPTPAVEPSKPLPVDPKASAQAPPPPPLSHRTFPPPPPPPPADEGIDVQLLDRGSQWSGSTEK